MANSLRLLKLQEEVRRMLIDGQISMGHARALLPLEIVEEQIAAAHKVADRHLSVRDTEKMVRDILKTSAAPAQEKNRPAEPQEDPSIQVIYKQIEDRVYDMPNVMSRKKQLLPEMLYAISALTTGR